MKQPSFVAHSTSHTSDPNGIPHFSAIREVAEAPESSGKIVKLKE
jgi:hypothetical protein